MTRKDIVVQKPESVNIGAGNAEATRVEPNHDQVRCRAYEIYTERCQSGGDGNALADWCAAERELKAKTNDGRQPAKVGGELSRRQA